MTNKAEITSENLRDVRELEGQFSSGTFRFPRNAYRGELRTRETGERVANIYCYNHEVFIAEPKEFGRGEIVKMVPGTFNPKQFERAGGYNVSATRRVEFWQFKEGNQ